MLHERKPNRLRNYDYSQDNLYYITSCVKDRICCFGSVVDKKMISNDYGNIAKNQWNWLFQQYPYLLYHVFVIASNHILRMLFAGTPLPYLSAVRSTMDFSILISSFSISISCCCSWMALVRMGMKSLYRSSRKPLSSLLRRP